MRRVLAICLLALLPLTAAAQDTGAEEGDDRSRLVRFLESALSDDAARQVRIEGFRGALSSTAELDRLTISDAEGVWLTLENARLDWSRAALLRGALQVNDLSAERLILDRLPVTEDDLPPAEARPFALPELPVSVNIDNVDLERVEIGPSVLGEAVAFTLSGAAELEGGAGAANLQLERLDGPLGRFRLQASYSNETEVLATDLLFEEAENGLAATLLGIPDQPALRLSVEGEGPLSDFAAEIALRTNGAQQIAGTVTARETEADGRLVIVDLSGNVSALVQPQYRAFFGQTSRFGARITRSPDGTLTMEDLRLETAALTAGGRLQIDPAGRPDSFALTGRIASSDPASDTVLLPVAGGGVTLGSAAFELDYSRWFGNSFTGRVQLDRLTADSVSLGRADLTLDGTITELREGGVAVAAATRARVSGIAHEDPASAAAIGPRADLSAALAWQTGLPVRLTDLIVETDTVRLAGRLSGDLAEDGVQLDFAFDTSLPDLEPFREIAGQPLAGAADLSVAGEASLPSGAFDITVDGETRDLQVAEGLPPQLFAGTTTLDARVVRDAAGLSVPSLQLSGREVSVTASGTLSSQRGEVEAEGSLRDARIFTSALSGPVTASARLQRLGDQPWQIDTQAAGPGGLSVNVTGGVGLPGGAVDLRAVGRAPLALADQAIAPRSIRGDLTFDMRLAGPPSLSALSGSFSTSGARIVAPVLQLVLENVSATGQIAGGRAVLDASGNLSTGGVVQTSGSVAVGTPGFPADLAITVSQARLIDPTLYEAVVESAALTVTGPLAGGARIAGVVTLGTTEIRVPETRLGTTEPIPSITHLGDGAAIRRTRGFAGITDGGQGGGGGAPGRATAIDVEIRAPSRIFLRGRGLDAELGGTLRLGGTTADIIPSGRFDLIRGRLSILGRRLDLAEGFITLRGDFDPFLRLVAQSEAGEYTILIILEGPASAPEVTFEARPDLPEDEVLAQLLFGRSISGLSAVQALQLADAVSALAGGNASGGLFESLRENLGLDDLDIQADENGGAAVRAGRYLSDNIYTDITVGTEGEADLSLNIDLTPSITARGTFGSSGESSVGVFFERDY